MVLWIALRNDNRKVQKVKMLEPTYYFEGEINHIKLGFAPAPFGKEAGRQKVLLQNSIHAGTQKAHIHISMILTN